MAINNKGISMPTVFFFSVFILIFVYAFTALINKENMMLLLDKKVKMARENAIRGAIDIKAVVKNRLEHEWIESMPEPKPSTYIIPIGEDDLKDYINNGDYTGFLVHEIDDAVIAYYETIGITVGRVFTPIDGSDTTAQFRTSGPDYEAEIILTANRSASGWVPGWGEPNYAQIHFNYIIISAGSYTDGAGHTISKIVELEGKLPVLIHIKRETIAQYAYYVVHNGFGGLPSSADFRHSIFQGDGTSKALFSGPVHVKDDIYCEKGPVINSKCTIDPGKQVKWWDPVLNNYIDIFDSVTNKLEDDYYTIFFKQNVYAEEVELDLTTIIQEQRRVATDQNNSVPLSHFSYQASSGVYLNPANKPGADFARIILSPYDNRTKLKIEVTFTDPSRTNLAGTPENYYFTIADNRDLIVFCEGKMIVSGTIPKRARVTLAAMEDLYVEGDLMYDTNVYQASNDDTVFGVVSWTGYILFTQGCRAHGVFVALGDPSDPDSIAGVGPEYHYDMKIYPGNIGGIQFLGGVLTKYAVPFKRIIEGFEHGFEVSFTYDSFLNKGKTPPFFPCNGDYIVTEDLRPVLYDSFKTTYR